MNDNEYLEVKVHRGKVGVAVMRKIVKQNAKILVSAYPITAEAKTLAKEEGVLCFENVKLEELELDIETEGE